MTNSEAADDEEEEIHFVPLTDETLIEINRRVTEEKTAKKKQSDLGDANVEGTENEDTERWPDYFLQSGSTLASNLKRRFPVALTGRALKEIDPYYENKQTFVVINQRRKLYRLSTAKTAWLFDPLHIVRRAAIWHVTHPFFSLLMNTIILANCLMLIHERNDARDAAVRVFTALYTVEFILYFLAKGFAFHPFSYLRDPWHWFDLILLILDYIHCSYLPMNVYFGVLRAIRLIRAMGTTTLIPGVANVVTGIYYSVRNAVDIFIVGSYPLFVFAVVGLQVYMGMLTQKCIKNPELNMSHEDFVMYAENYSNWFIEDWYEPKVCGNASGSGMCPENFTCLHGYGENPNYGYTSFDTFGWSLLSAFRLMLLDFWEDVQYLVIRAAGPWHVLFFISIIFVGRYVIFNLILIVITLSYKELRQMHKLERQNELDEKEHEKIAMKELNVDTNEDNRALDHTVTTPVLDNDDDTDWEKTKASSPPSSKFVTLFCKWECCGCCKTFQEKLQIIAYDPFTELFLAVCVIVSTMILCLNHNGMEIDLHYFVNHGTCAFALIFAIEVVVKLLATSPYLFFKEFRNVYEFTVLLLTIPTLFVEDMTAALALWKIVNILRAFRLFRIFKVARASRTMNTFIATMMDCLLPFAVLVVLLFIIIFMFAVMGVEFYDHAYEEQKHRFYDGEVPRWNFIGFMHSFMLVFRGMCSEWIESMWDAVLVAGYSPIPYFILLALIGNVVVYVMFFAVVYVAYTEAKNIKPPAENEVTIAWGRCMRAFDRICQTCCGRKARTILPHDVRETSSARIMGEDKNTSKSMTSVELALEEVVETGSAKREGVITVQPTEKDDKNGVKDLRSPSASSQKSKSSPGNDSCNGDQHSGKGDGGKSCKKSDTDAEPNPCCPVFCYGASCCDEKNNSCWTGWKNIRSLALKLIDIKWYEIVIALCIIVSSILLACENKTTPDVPTFENGLHCAVFVFEVLFLVDMLIKWLALGFKTYFSNPWLLLDFVILMISVIIYGSLICGFTPILVEFQSLRPLRILARIQGARVIVGALMGRLGSVLWLLLFCFLIWVVFSIVGVVLFAGKFQRCVDADRERLNASHINDRIECEQINEYSWEDADVNFNNVASGFLPLFFIATWKGWIEVIHNAVDSRHEHHLQPIPEENLYMFFFFIVFIIVGTFFTFNLFAAVIIQEFFAGKLKNGQDEGLILNEDIMVYRRCIRLARSSTLPERAPQYTWKLRNSAYKIVTDRRFVLAMVIIYTLNLVVMAFDHISIEDSGITVLEIINILFVFIYVTEYLFKMFALGIAFFKSGWNIFDLIVVILLLARIIVHDLVAKYFIGAPIFLWLLKVFQPGKVKTLLSFSKGIRNTKGIRNLFAVCASASPSLLIVSFVYFVITFVYALFGVQLFKNIEDGGALDDLINFGSFGQAFTILFQLTTTAGWDGMLKPLMEKNEYVSVIYFLSYIVISFLIIIKLYTAVILENFDAVTTQVQEGLTEDDFDSFNEVWKKYDQYSTQFIKHDQLSDLLAELEDPFCIRKPNKFKIITMDIDIYLGDVVNRIDIMEALVKDFMFRRGKPVDEPDEPHRKEAHGKVIVSSTLFRQREDVSAQIIQHTLRRYRNNKVSETNISTGAPKSAGSRKSEFQQEDSKLIEIAD